MYRGPKAVMAPVWCRPGCPEWALVPALQPAVQDAARHNSISAAVPGISLPVTFPRTISVPKACVPVPAGAHVSADGELWPRASAAAFSFLQIPVQGTRLRNADLSGSCVSNI